MAEIVAAIGVPHTPGFPDLVARLGPNCEVARLFAEVERRLSAVQPDVLVIFDSDHLNTFFFNNLPTFCIGAADRTAGPNDHTKMPRYELGVDWALAQSIRSYGIGAGFDLSLSEEFEIDHSIMVPLHFVTPQMNIPIVPIFINGLSPPLPASRRCFALGEMVRRAIDSWPKQTRVAIVASGSFSLEIGGPRISHGKRSSVPDPEWARSVLRRLEKAEINELLNEATSDRLLKAGNIGGELLNWIAMLGAIGQRRPQFIEPQIDHGHAYAVWRWD
jgi:aromatic ring-opening dioxygenase catalytic subunit (LigB family)